MPSQRKSPEQRKSENLVDQDQLRSSNLDVRLSITLEIFTKLIGLIAGLVAVAYVFGFVVTNTYLLQYGFFTLELFQAKYVASGSLFLLLNLVILAEPIYDFTVLVRLRLANKRISTLRFVQNGVVAWLWCMFAIFAFSTLVSMSSMTLVKTPFGAPSIPVTADSIDLASEKTLILFSNLLLWSALVFLLFKAAVLQIVSRKSAIYVTQEKKPMFKLSLITFPIIGGFPWVVLTIVLFSVLVYPLVPPSFGGGAPLQVQLLADEDARDHFELLGIIDKTSKTKEHALLSRLVYLVDETSGQYFLLTEDSIGSVSSIALDRDLVKGVVYPHLEPALTAQFSITSTSVLTVTVVP